MQQGEYNARKRRGSQRTLHRVEKAVHQIGIQRDLLQQAKRKVTQEAM
jgi:hypothetical protein